MKKKDLKNRISYAVVGFIVKLVTKLLFGMKIREDDRVKGWKKSKEGFVILCAHPSEFDAVVLLAFLFPRYAKFVVGAQQLYKPGLLPKIIRSFGVIPKKQFTSDISSIKDMISAVKSGYALAMMPEGRVSLDGTCSPIDVSTAKLIKRMGAPVAVIVPKGSYFVKPPYNYTGLIRGKVGGEIKAVLSAEETAALSQEEIMDRVCKALEYNASEELRGSGNRYAAVDGAYMKDVSNLFYLCPKCGELMTVSDSDSVISCSACGMSMKALPTMFFEGEPGLPDNIVSWNALQKEWERRFWAEDGAELRLHVRKATMLLKEDTEYKEKCSGELVLSAAGLHYKDAEEEFSVPLGTIHGVSTDYKFGHIVYYQGDLMRRFSFDDKRLAARFVNSLMTLKQCGSEQ